MMNPTISIDRDKGAELAFTSADGECVIDDISELLRREGIQCEDSTIEAILNSCRYWDLLMILRAVMVQRNVDKLIEERDQAAELALDPVLKTIVSTIVCLPGQISRKKLLNDLEITEQEFQEAKREACLENLDGIMGNLVPLDSGDKF